MEALGGGKAIKVEPLSLNPSGLEEDCKRQKGHQSDFPVLGLVTSQASSGLSQWEAITRWRLLHVHFQHCEPKQRSFISLHKPTQPLVIQTEAHVQVRPASVWGGTLYPIPPNASVIHTPVGTQPSASKLCCWLHCSKVTAGES